MPQPTRRSAGNRVLTRARALSDDLLADEETCFAQIDDAIASAIPAGRAILSTAWRRAKKDPRLGVSDAKRLASDAKLQTDLYDEHRRAIDATRLDVGALAQSAVDRSLVAIADELQICEQVAARKYVGTAAIGVKFARSVAPDLIDAFLKIHADSEVAALIGFGDEMRAQLNLAALAGDDLPVVEGRLFSVEPFRATGIGGRGVWVRTGSDLQASARGMSVGLMNQTRQAAMAGMNEAARAR